MKRSKNSYRLNGKRSQRGYDWWWHSFVGRHAESGALKPFFIEYYVINPGLNTGDIIWGQDPRSKEQEKRPSYAMIKAGAWGEGKSQLHNFYSIDEFRTSTQRLSLRIGHNLLSEKFLIGRVMVSEKDRDRYPERMSDAGSMSWDLKIEKDLSFDVGYGSSHLSNKLGLFRMYWHVEGMRCQYSGEVIYNEQKYLVEPDTSCGYQDKNWGRDYTNPWIWLSCNNFYSVSRGVKADVSLDLGGGCPVVLGIPMKRKILTALYYEGKLLEFNFSKFWKRSRQEFNCHEDDTHVHWDVKVENSTHVAKIRFRCEKSKMLLVNYENPDGLKHHDRLWNGGHGHGTLSLYGKKGRKLKLIDELRGELAGCEYGEHA